MLPKDLENIVWSYVENDPLHDELMCEIKYYWDTMYRYISFVPAPAIGYFIETAYAEEAEAGAWSDLLVTEDVTDVQATESLLYGGTGGAPSATG